MGKNPLHFTDVSRTNSVPNVMVYPPCLVAMLHLSYMSLNLQFASDIFYLDLFPTHCLDFFKQKAQVIKQFITKSLKLSKSPNTWTYHFLKMLNCVKYLKQHPPNYILVLWFPETLLISQSLFGLSRCFILHNWKRKQKGDSLAICLVKTLDWYQTCFYSA